MLKSVLVLITLSNLALASNGANDLCWTKEENPATKQPYTSHEEWDNDVKAWKMKSHLNTNIVNLAKAFRLYSNEKAKANSFGHDKVAHCYMGCRLSQGINYNTSDYLAWYKELKDVTDCSLDSHFEEADYVATVLGANAGKDKSIQCEAYCLTQVPH